MIAFVKLVLDITNYRSYSYFLYNSYKLMQLHPMMLAIRYNYYIQHYSYLQQLFEIYCYNQYDYNRLFVYKY